MFYPSSAGTLTFVRTVETCIESILPPYPNDSQQWVISFVLVRTIRSCVHIIKLPNPIIKLTFLKIIILLDFEIKSKFQSRRRSCFPAIHKTLHVGCFQLAITISVVTKNACMSRHWKAGQVDYGIHQ
jgi:hypothetical protein